MLGGCVANHFIVGGLVVLPKSAFLDVGHRKFPIFLGIVEPFEETLLLFLARKMQKEFDDDHAVAGEIALKAADVFESFFPDIFRDERFGNFLCREKMFMYAHDEHFLVIRAIEDADFASLWHSF